MESYRMALEPCGIGVSVCCPANIKTNIFEAARTRPEHLKNTGYLVNKDSIASLRRLHASGMEPVVLANHIKKGIEEAQLYNLAASSNLSAIQILIIDCRGTPSRLASLSKR